MSETNNASSVVAGELAGDENQNLPPAAPKSATKTTTAGVSLESNHINEDNNTAAETIDNSQYRNNNLINKDDDSGSSESEDETSGLLKADDIEVRDSTQTTPLLTDTNTSDNIVASELPNQDINTAIIEDNAESYSEEDEEVSELMSGGDDDETRESVRPPRILDTVEEADESDEIVTMWFEAVSSGNQAGMKEMLDEGFNVNSSNQVRNGFISNNG